MTMPDDLPVTDLLVTDLLVTELRELARRVAVEATELATRLRSVGLSVERKSTVTDLVTNADRACEELILGRLADARPDDATLGEEGGATEGSSGVRWVIDPIDGTTNYVYDHPGWACSIAAEVGGVAVAGAVVVPTLGAVFTAGAGQGTTLGSRMLRIAEPPRLTEALVATGFGYEARRRRHQAVILSHVLPRGRDIRRAGAAAVDLCSVAAGRVDAYYETGLGPWDLAAGALIATEAGARVGSLDGGPAVAGELVIATHPDLFDALCALLREGGA